MKKIAQLILLLLLLLPACAPAAQPTEVPASDTPPPTLDDSEFLGDVLIHRLSVNLGLDEDEINLKEHQEVEFNDLCLDVALPDTACAQVLTPGQLFVFEANGIEYEYHTTEAGDSIQPASLALVWTREGGIAGFCDRLTVYLSGEVYASNCRSQPKETSGTLAELTTPAQRDQFNAWYVKFDETTLDVSDPAGVSDRMMNTLEFFGDGTGKPGKVDQQLMLDWALKLFQKLNS